MSIWVDAHADAHTDVDVDADADADADARGWTKFCVLAEVTGFPFVSESHSYFNNKK